MRCAILYSKYRPHQFKGVVGQAAVVGLLQNQLRTNSVGHAYLFGGPSGTGKTTLARILAAASNCDKLRAGEPCAKCPSCKAVQAGAHWDVMEIDAASNRGIDDIRSLTAKAAYAPMSRRKVYIIDEAHGLTDVAWDALLKSLEDPPPYMTWIFCTTVPDRLPETVRSRCQRCPVKAVSSRDIAPVLARVAKSERVTIEAAGLQFLAEASAQNVRTALTALEQVIGANGKHVTTKKARQTAQALAMF